jgi:hypothetical protein
MGKDLMRSEAPAEPQLPIRRLIGEFMSAAPGVERVLVSSDERAICVWSIVNNLPADKVHQIYACEHILLDRFRQITIDFHVVDRRDAPADGLIPGAETIYIGEQGTAPLQSAR